MSTPHRSPGSRPASLSGPALVADRLRRFRGRDTAEPHRASSPLELLYDLTIAVGFSTAAGGLAEQLAEGHVLSAAAGFALAALAVS